jgi:hypothetical protein
LRAFNQNNQIYSDSIELFSSLKIPEYFRSKYDFENHLNLVMKKSKKVSYPGGENHIFGLSNRSKKVV